MMAEVDGRSSIKDDQNEDNDSVCTPCFEDNIREQAIKYCPECKEFLCKGCTRHHGRQRMSRSHKLVDKTEAEKSSQVAMTTKCLYHQDREIEMYCGEHDMVYCYKCIATDHGCCTGVTCLDDMTVSKDQNMETERLMIETRTIQERLVTSYRKTQTYVKTIKEQRIESISQVKTLAQDLMEHIQKLERKALYDVNADYSLVQGKLEEKTSEITKRIQDIEQVNDKFQGIDSLTKRQQFVQTKLIKHTLKDALNVFEQIEAKGNQSLRFTENTVFKSFIISSISIGSVQKVTERGILLSSKIYKVNSKKEINIRMLNDCNHSYICDTCQLPDDTIIMADSKNCRIKRLDENYKVKDCFDLEAHPTGICCTGNTKIAETRQQ